MTRVFTKPVTDFSYQDIGVFFRGEWVGDPVHFFYSYISIRILSGSVSWWQSCTKMKEQP